MLLLFALYLNATGAANHVFSESFSLSTSADKSVFLTQQSAILTTSANLPLASKVVKESSTTWLNFMFCGFLATLKVSQRHFTFEFFRYSNHLQNFPIKFQKFDIPFPFHTYW